MKSTRSFVVPPEKQQQFKELTTTPQYAYKTIALGLLTFLGVVGTYIAYFSGAISLITGTVLITICYYYTFSPIHDAIHRALARDTKVNDFIGGLNVMLVSPYTGLYGGLKFFRWYHTQHHRFTNDESDPDKYVHGSWLRMPFAWMTIDYHYLYLALTQKAPVAMKAIREMVPSMIVTTIAIIALIYYGYGWEVLLLWYIPGRLTFLILGFVFFWLPHAHFGKVPHNVKQSENLTIATTVRKGFEWLLSPLMQWQNYHLIHHMWPTTPFYNNHKIWVLLEDELTQYDLAVQKNFSIMPEIQLAPKPANEQSSGA